MNLSPNIRASLYMMLSMMGFTVNDSLIKSLDGSLGVSQIMAVRGALLSVLIGIIIVQQNLHKRLPELLSKKILFRSATEVLATLCFLSALSILPFATIAAILQSLPLAVAVGAAVFLSEPVGWRRWVAIGIGFIGVLIIIRPGMNGFQATSLLVLLSVVFAAARDLVTRTLPESLPSLLVSAVTTVAICLSGVALTTIQGDWRPVSSQQLFTLSLASFFLFFGYQFIVMAMRTGEVAYVVPYRYTSLIWAIALGYLFFNEIPDQLTILGSAIVIATGLFTLYREIVTGRRSVTTTTIGSRGNVWSERKK
ncbi:hypothetical protein AB833_01090 [Chromatiales bacterium (ex Bugula neritina AB1)]|nr:hypothetical protein AB833_01090 [Chromatiales bacterium (ex Bugula neritina AB1)]